MISGSHSKYMLKEPGFGTRSVSRLPLWYVLASEQSYQCGQLEGLGRVSKSTSGR